MSRRLRPNISPEEGLDAHAYAWAFVFDCWQKKVVGTSTSTGGSTYSHETKGDGCDLEKRAIFGKEGDITDRKG